MDKHWKGMSYLSLALLLLVQVATTPTVDAFSNDISLLTSTTSSAATAAAASSSKAVTSTCLYSSIPQSKNKKKSKASRKRKSSASSSSNNKGPPGRSLTVDELSEHVSGRYITGRGGPLDGKTQRRGVFESNEEQGEYLKKLNSHPALVLNADYQPLSYLPLSLWSWQEAMKAIFSGKVQVVDVYPDVTIRAANLEVPLPSVIALTEYVKHVNKQPAFTRRNVFLRDEYRCQYCTERFHTRDLSLDHVKPRCMGGQLNWENAVTSCKKCNGRKGSLTLPELRSVGMKLMQEPRVPTQMELAARAARMVPRRVHPTWKPYIGLGQPKPSTTSSSSSSATSGGDENFIDERYFEESD